MLMDWLFATLAGIELGLLLYVVVRLRMFFGPRIRERFGNLTRRIFWGFTLVFMVVLANLNLLGLRALLEGRPAEGNVTLEIWFAILALLLPFTLIYLRMQKRRAE